MMQEWTDLMSCSKEEYDYLNELVASCNRNLGREVFELESTPDGYENECVDLYQGGSLNTSYFSFEDATTYLEGVRMGILLKGAEYE